MNGLFEALWNNRKDIQEKFTSDYTKALKESQVPNDKDTEQVKIKKLMEGLEKEIEEVLDAAHIKRSAWEYREGMLHVSLNVGSPEARKHLVQIIGNALKKSGKFNPKFSKKEWAFEFLPVTEKVNEDEIVKGGESETKPWGLTYRKGYDIVKSKSGKFYMQIMNGSLQIFKGPEADTAEEAETLGKAEVLKTNPKLAANTGIGESINEQGFEEEEKEEPDEKENTPDFDDLHDKMKDNSEEDGTPLPPEEPGESEAAKEKEVPEKEYLGKTEDDTFFYLNRGDKGLHITDAEGKIVYPKASDKREDQVGDELSDDSEEPLPNEDELEFIIKAQQELEMTEISADILTRYVQPALDQVEREREEQEGFEFETPPGEGETEMTPKGPAPETPEEESPEEEAEESEEEEEEELDDEGKPKKKKIGSGEQPITIESKVNEEKFDQHDKDEMADQLFDKPYKELTIHQQSKVTDELDKLYKSPKLGEKVNEVKVVFNGHTYDVVLEADNAEGGVHIRINGQGPYHFTAPFVEMFGRDKNGGLTEDSIKELGQSALSAMNSTHLEKVASAGIHEAVDKMYTVELDSRRKDEVTKVRVRATSEKEAIKKAKVKYGDIKAKCTSIDCDEAKVSKLHERLLKIAEAQVKEEKKKYCPTCLVKGKTVEMVKNTVPVQGSGPYRCPSCGQSKDYTEHDISKKESQIPDDKDNEQTKIKKLMERNWKWKLDLGFLADIFYGDQEEYDVQELGKKVQAAITSFVDTNKNLPEEVKDELEAVAANFQDVSDNDEFDGYMSELYDIGDGYSIWVDTMTHPDTKKEPPAAPKPANERKQLKEAEEKSKEGKKEMNDLIQKARTIIQKGHKMTEDDYNELGYLTGQMSKHMSLGLHTASEKAVEEMLAECKKVIEDHDNSIKVGDYIQVKDLEDNTTIVPSAKVFEIDSVEEDAESYPTYEITGSQDEDEQMWYSTKEYIIRKLEGYKPEEPTKESIKEGLDAVGRIDAFRDALEGIRTAAHQIDHDLMKISNKRLANRFLTFVTSELKNLTSGKAWKLYNQVESALKAGPVDPSKKKDEKDKKDDKKTDESITEDTDVAKIEPFKNDTELASAIRKDIMAEQEAIALYQSHAEATDNEQAKKLLTDIGEEEQVHVGELTKLLSMIQPKDDNLHDEGEKEAEDKVGSEEKEVEEAKEEPPKDKPINPTACSKCGKPVKAEELVNGMSKCCSALPSFDAPADKDDGKGNLTDDPQEEEPVSTEEVDKAVKTKMKEASVGDLLEHLDNHQSKEGQSYEEKF